MHTRKLRFEVNEDQVKEILDAEDSKKVFAEMIYKRVQERKSNVNRFHRTLKKLTD